MVDSCPGTGPDRDITGGHGDGRRLEQRRIDHPAESPSILVDESYAAANLQPGGTEQRLRQGARTGRKEDAIPPLSTDLSSKAGALRLREILRHWPAELAVLADQHVRQTAVAALPGKLLPPVQLLAWLTCTTRHHDCTDVLGLKHSKSCRCKVGGEVDQLPSEPQVRLVGAEAVHG